MRSFHNGSLSSSFRTHPGEPLQGPQENSDRAVGIGRPTTTLESTLRYLGVEVDDGLEITEHIEIQRAWERGQLRATHPVRGTPPGEQSPRGTCRARCPAKNGPTPAYENLLRGACASVTAGQLQRLRWGRVTRVGGIGAGLLRAH